jgi:DNA-binding CsgD family transcriptional regulator
MGELQALHWRDVDFEGSTIRTRASYAAGRLTTPKSGRVRAVPMAPDVAAAIAQLGRRDGLTGDGDLVFVGEEGGYLDGSALRRRYRVALLRAGLRRLRRRVAARAKEPPRSTPLEELTDREREVMALAAAGLSNEQIAERLVVSAATAETHVSRAMIKLGARDRAQLVVLAYESGLVRPGWVE